MDLTEIISADLSEVNVLFSDKNEFFEACARKVAHHISAREVASGVSEETLLAALTEREREGSTGFGNEIAIPHARVEGLEKFVLFIVTHKKGIPFGARDKRAVKLFFVLLGPSEKVNEHLKILAFISRTVSRPEVKDEIVKAATPRNQVESFLRNADPDAIVAASEKPDDAMSLLFLVLYNEDCVEEVLEVFLEYGIEGATILDSSGMGKFISNTPLFGNFIGCMHQNKHHSKTILTLVSTPHIPALVRAIEGVTGDIARDQSATVFSVDLTMHKGSMDIV